MCAGEVSDVEEVTPSVRLDLVEGAADVPWQLFAMSRQVRAELYNRKHLFLDEREKLFEYRPALLDGDVFRQKAVAACCALSQPSNRPSSLWEEDR